jgi:TPR repeat protein
MKTLIFKLTTLTMLIGATVTSYGMNHPLSLTATHHQNNSDGDVEMTDAETKQAHQAEVKSKDAKAAAAQRSTIVKIHVPGQNSQEEILEDFDLESEYFITFESYQKLIDSQATHGDAFILARHECVDENGNTHIRYYDAHEALNWLFKRSYPLQNITANERDLKDANNGRMVDMTKTPIRNITFYTYHPQEHDQGFQFLCSYRDLMAEDQSANHWILKFYANQNNLHNKDLKQESLATLCDKGLGYFKNNELRKALTYLVPISQQTYDQDSRSAALYFLARIYLKDSDLQNLARGKEYLMLACKEEGFGKWNALTDAGRMYMCGYADVEVDFARAENFFIPVATQNDQFIAKTTALHHLGYIYLMGGHGIKKDLKKSVAYFEQVLDHGVGFPKTQNERTSAYYYLGTIYSQSSEGIEKDAKKAVEYLTLAATQKDNFNIHIKASSALAELFDEETNYVDAHTYYKLVAEQSTFPIRKAGAILSLGVLYGNGFGVEKNWHKAHDYYRAAAQQSDDLFVQANAFFNLGCIYSTGGHGIEKNIDQAHNYFALAAKQSASEEIRKDAQACINDLQIKQFQARRKAGLGLTNTDEAMAQAPTQADGKKRKENPSDHDDTDDTSQPSKAKKPRIDTNKK